MFLLACVTHLSQRKNVKILQLQKNSLLEGLVLSQRFSFSIERDCSFIVKIKKEHNILTVSTREAPQI